MHQLELCLDYWPGSGSGEVTVMRGPHYTRVSHKQVVLTASLIVLVLKDHRIINIHQVNFNKLCVL